MIRYTRLLWVVSAAAGGLALLVAFTGGGTFYIGPLRVSAHSFKAPLLLGIVAGLFAVLGTYRSVPPPRGHRGVWFVVPLVCLTMGVNILLQAQPQPPPGVAACLFDYPLREGFRFFLNCDSPAFLDLARNPSSVFEDPVRQSRPLTFAIPYVIARPLMLLPATSAVPIGAPYQPAFFGFIVMNVAALAAGLVLFARLLELAAEHVAGPELLVGLLIVGANDLTKLFLWTPHSQIFNILTPCLTLYLSFRLFARRRPLGARQAIVLGAALGVGLLTYGTFAIPIVCVVFIQAVSYRRLGTAALLMASACAVYGLWVAFMKWHVGEFHSYEIEEYRQFVWMLDCGRVDIRSCGPIAAHHLKTFFNTSIPVMVVPITLAFLCRLARTSAGDAVPISPGEQALARSVALTFVMTMAFLALMGFYAPRLCWALVAPIVLMATFDAHRLRVMRPVRWPWLLDAAVVASAMAYLFVLAGRPGPYN
jgi:hypothetical protein